MGEAVKIQLKNNKKKVKWSITSGKKNVTLSKKKKTGVTIKGKKAGKAKVQAKIGKKKYVCKVTVKKAATHDNDNPNNGKTTTEPTQGEYPKVCVNLQTGVRYNYAVWRFLLWQEEKVTHHRKQQCAK